jgi:hypothetical protein
MENGGTRKIMEKKLLKEELQEEIALNKVLKQKIKATEERVDRWVEFCYESNEQNVETLQRAALAEMKSDNYKWFCEYTLGILEVVEASMNDETERANEAVTMVEDVIDILDYLVGTHLSNMQQIEKLEYLREQTDRTSRNRLDEIYKLRLEICGLEGDLQYWKDQCFIARRSTKEVE